MKFDQTIVLWLVTFLLSTSVEGFDLPSNERAGQPGPIALPTPQTAPGGKLDLRLGDIRRYVPEHIWATPVAEELENVEVVGRPGTPDMVETRPIPGGLGGLWWAARRPGKAWRLLVPDQNREETDPPEGR